MIRDLKTGIKTNENFKNSDLFFFLVEINGLSSAKTMKFQNYFQKRISKS
jgi:hypothetical protein